LNRVLLGPEANLEGEEVLPGFRFPSPIYFASWTGKEFFDKRRIGRKHSLFVSSPQ
jgi:hypothetical protein